MGQPARLEKLSLTMQNAVPQRHHALGDPFKQGTPAPSNADGFIVPDVGQSTKRPLRSARIILMPPAPWFLIVPCLQLCSFVVGSAFVDASTSVGIRQSKILCLGLSLRFSSKSLSDSRASVYITWSHIR